MDWRYPGTLLTLDDWTNQVEWFFRGFRRSRLQWVNGLFFLFLSSLWRIVVVAPSLRSFALVHLALN